MMKRVLSCLIIFISFNVNAFSYPEEFWSTPEAVCGWIMNYRDGEYRIKDNRRVWLIEGNKYTAQGFDRYRTQIEEGDTCVCLVANTIFDVGVIAKITDVKHFPPATCVQVFKVD